MLHWDEDFQHFKEFGADNPEYINWGSVFPTGAYIVEIDVENLKGIINQNSVLLAETTDIDQDKMDQLDEHLANGGACCPPWGIIDSSGQLSITQGKHRFQKAIFVNENFIPIVVNEEDKNSLVNAGVAISFRKMSGK